MRTYSISVNTTDLNAFTVRTRAGAQGHVYARSLRALRANPSGETAAEK